MIFLPLPADDPKQRQPDIRLARELLRWEPVVGIDDGLQRTIEYFQSAYPSAVERPNPVY